MNNWRFVLILLSTWVLVAPTAAQHSEPQSPPRTFKRAMNFVERLEEHGTLPRTEVDPPLTTGDAFINAGRGPVPVHIPADYDPEQPTPLIVLLHGYSNDGADVEAWMQIASLVDSYGFLYLYPTGNSDFLGNPFWNATDACCDLFGGNPDDSSYLRALVDIMQTEYNVDPRRIHFIGHSNGGFMSYRMACDHADIVASIVSLAGATFLDPADCTPTEPIHTLQIHGTSDGVINYNGGCILSCYPGAVETTETWAAYDSCAIIGTPILDPLDIDADIAGDETTVVQYTTDCAPGGSAEIWTIAGGPHSPNLSNDFRFLVVEFLLNHPKPNPCPADIDGSSTVDVTDLLALLADWGPCDDCDADLNDDGTVDVSDLLDLLAQWGSCD